MTFFNPRSQYIHYLHSDTSAASGLRFIVECDQDEIIDIFPQLGFSRKGIEKLIEEDLYQTGTQHLDKLDYISPAAQELAYMLAVEQLTGITVPMRAQFLRIMVCELSRILNHCMFIHLLARSMDIDSAGQAALMIFYDVWSVINLLTGTDAPTCNFCFGGVKVDINDTKQEYTDFLDRLPHDMAYIDRKLTNNSFFKKYTTNLGVISKAKAFEYGVSGANLRSTGVSWDLRINQPYSAYHLFNFSAAVCDGGGVYARYMVRRLEIDQSIRIIRQVLENIPPGDIVSDVPFPLFVPSGNLYQAVESARGEFGIHLFSDGENKPARCRVRSAGFSTLQIVHDIVECMQDLPVVLASLDLMASEIDR